MPEQDLKKRLQSLIHSYKNPKRTALSLRYPLLKTIILFVKKTLRHAENIIDHNIYSYNRKKPFPFIAARHQSILIRKLGDSDRKLQERKVINLKKAVEKLDGIVIPPGKIFSLWNVIGKPTRKKGYVDGMLLSNGKVIEGLGGGLCQLANFLHWIFLHVPSKNIERYHHSRDVFPDSGRTLPFGSGATIMYNYVDLKTQNTSSVPLQIKIWVNDTHLKGQIRSAEKIPSKFHVFEKNHYFVKSNDEYYRYNEIWREKKIQGDKIGEEKITENFAPVLYEIDEEEIQRKNQQLIII